MKYLYIISDTDKQRKQILEGRLEFISDLVKFVDIENISDFHDKKLFYIYLMDGDVSHRIKQNNNLLVSNFILEKLKLNKNLNLIYISDSETDYNDIFNVLEQKLKEYEIEPERVWIVNGNELLPYLSSISKTNINFHVSQRLKEMSVKDIMRNKEDIYFNKKYLFQCYNHYQKAHRIIILALLNQYNLLDKTNWSFIKNENYDVSASMDILSYEMFNFYKKDLESIKKIGNKKCAEENFEFCQSYSLNFSKSYEDNSYKHSYINIVNESQFERDGVIHITEKSFIPLYFYQIPIFVSTYGHVTKMKELYGFDIFEDIIDHSYDLEKNNEKRILMIGEQIQKLNDFSFIKSFYEKEETINRMNKNRKIVESIANNEKDRLFFEGLIS